MNLHDLQKYARDLDILDIELIAAYILQKPREYILAHPETALNQKQEKNIQNLIERRIQGEPLAYLTGHKEFYGHDFLVNEHTLIPRPETELLVETTLQEIQKKDQEEKIYIIDIGTGSGCILISLAKEILRLQKNINQYTFIGSDISANALIVAKKNALQLGVKKYISFYERDLLVSTTHKISTTSFSSIIITANLPYVPSVYLQDLSTKETAGLIFEPASALDGGSDGLVLYRKLIEQIKILKEQFPHASITSIFEIDPEQKKELQTILKQSKDVSFIKDLSHHWRICLYRT